MGWGSWGHQEKEVGLKNLCIKKFQLNISSKIEVPTFTWLGLEAVQLSSTKLRKSQLKLQTCQIETKQYFLIKLGIYWIGNNDLVRPTKILNNLVKDLKILSFKVTFQCLKLVETFRKKNSVNNIWLGDQYLLMKCFENFDF